MYSSYHCDHLLWRSNIDNPKTKFSTYFNAVFNYWKGNEKEWKIPPIPNRTPVRRVTSWNAVTPLTSTDIELQNYYFSRVKSQITFIELFNCYGSMLTTCGGHVDLVAFV